MRTILALATGVALSTTAASAAPVTFFAEDTNPGGALSAAVAAEQAAFLSGLQGVGIEDFETSSLPDINFTGSTGTITATLAGGGASIESSGGSGRFATSGSNYVETSGGGDFTISFSSAIAAFGFYGTDIGDFDNSIVLEATTVGGGTELIEVGNTVGSPDGSLLFFGFTDTANSYTSIAFLNQPGGTDVFGFDDLIIGDVNQIIVDPDPNVVPLPAAGFLLVGALAGLGLTRRRKS